MTEIAARTPPVAERAPALLPLVALINVAATVTFGAISVLTPVLTRDLGVPVGHGIWIPDAYLVAVVCVTPLSAWLARRFGPRRLLLACLAGLVATAVGAAAAPSLELLVAAVFLHGLVAAPLAPVTQLLVAARLGAAERGRGMAWWTAGTLAGSLLGGTLGGPLAAVSGASPALLLCLPLAAIAVVALLRRPDLVDSREGRADGRGEAPDLYGAGLLIATTLSLGLLLNLGDNLDWFAHPGTLALSALFLASAIGFARHYRRTRNPILDLSPLRERRFAAAALVIFGANLVSTGQFETEMLGTVLGFDAGFLGLRAGLGGAGLLLGVGLAGLLVRRVPAASSLAIALALLLVGKGGYLLYDGPVGWFAGLWPALVSSLGFGLLASLLAACAFDRIAGPLLGAALGLAGLDAIMAVVGQIHPEDEAAGGRLAFEAIFTIEFVGAALLCLTLPAFRQR